MSTRSAIITALMALVAAFSVLPLSGCGGSTYESNEAFVESIHQGGGSSSAESDGTIPSIDEPMDNVAKIRFETTDLDLGLVKNDEIHHHKLKVYNDGKMPLKITKIDTTCACTMGYVTPETAVVQAGGESWIDVTLDPNRVPGFSSHKVLTITSTDPAQPQVNVDVRSSIEPEFYIDTEDVVLGDIPKGEAVERRVRIRQMQDIPMLASGIEVMAQGATAAKIPGLSARVEEIPEAQWQSPGKREYDVVIVTAPELSAGPFERTLVLLTDIKRLARFRIGVTGTAIAPYTPAPVYPERITLLPEGGDVVARATFTSTGPLSLAIAGTSNPLLTATVVPGTTPNEVSVEARMAAASVPHQLFDETVNVQVTAGGKTFTEIVGVRNAGNAEAPGDGHDH